MPFDACKYLYLLTMRFFLMQMLTFNTLKAVGLRLGLQFNLIFSLLDDV